MSFAYLLSVEYFAVVVVVGMGYRWLYRQYYRFLGSCWWWQSSC